MRKILAKWPLLAAALCTPTMIMAADAEGKYSSADTTWTLLGAMLVFFMQPGFAMVETGLTRAKNAGNIVMKNFMDFALGTIVFWVLGFGLMFGEDIGGIIGTPDFFVTHYDTGDAGYPPLVYLFFQTVFCATAATIVSGAMAERTKFSSYCIYSVLISLLIYPISGHWIWGGGWLSELGFHDFAGSTCVHMVGGVCALVGASLLGPRIGKYNEDGSVNAIPGHSITLACLGMFILWMGWFGFNGGSTVSMTGDDTILSVGSIMVTTNMAAAAGAVTTMLLTWVKYGKPDVSMTLNGGLAGLVAITAGTDVVSVAGSFWIGVIAGIAIVYAVEFVDQKMKIDDPVGAISAHGVCGALGTILTGFFGNLKAYAQEIIPLSNPFGRDDDNFRHGWTAFYWAWWISWSPFVGMFIARVSRGRTVRQFLIAVLVVPALISVLWMTTFGGTAISLTQAGFTGISDAALELKLFQMLSQLPFTEITSFIGIVLVIVFFITSSDSGSLVIDTIAAGGKINAPTPQRVFWCTFEGLVAIALLLAGGLGALQAMAVSTGFPFTLVLLGACWAIVKGLMGERRELA